MDRTTVVIGCHYKTFFVLFLLSLAFGFLIFISFLFLNGWYKLFIMRPSRPSRPPKDKEPSKAEMLAQIRAPRALSASQLLSLGSNKQNSSTQTLNRSATFTDIKQSEDERWETPPSPPQSQNGSDVKTMPRSSPYRSYSLWSPRSLELHRKVQSMVNDPVGPAIERLFQIAPGSPIAIVETIVTDESNKIKPPPGAAAVGTSSFEETGSELGDYKKGEKEVLYGEELAIQMDGLEDEEVQTLDLSRIESRWSYSSHAFAYRTAAISQSDVEEILSSLLDGRPFSKTGSLGNRVAILKAMLRDGTYHIRPILTEGDFILAVHELMDPRIFAGGGIQVPNGIINSPMRKGTRGIFEVTYELNRPLRYVYLDNGDLPTELRPFLCPLACRDKFTIKTLARDEVDDALVRISAEVRAAIQANLPVDEIMVSVVLHFQECILTSRGEESRNYRLFQIARLNSVQRVAVWRRDALAKMSSTVKNKLELYVEKQNLPPVSKEERLTNLLEEHVRVDWSPVHERRRQRDEDDTGNGNEVGSSSAITHLGIPSPEKDRLQLMERLGVSNVWEGHESAFVASPVATAGIVAPFSTFKELDSVKIARLRSEMQLQRRVDQQQMAGEENDSDDDEVTPHAHSGLRSGHDTGTCTGTEVKLKVEPIGVVSLAATIAAASIGSDVDSEGEKEADKEKNVAAEKEEGEEGDVVQLDPLSPVDSATNTADSMPKPKEAIRDEPSRRKLTVREELAILQERKDEEEVKREAIRVAKAMEEEEAARIAEKAVERPSLQKLREDVRLERAAKIKADADAIVRAAEEAEAAEVEAARLARKKIRKSMNVAASFGRKSPSGSPAKGTGTGTGTGTLVNSPTATAASGSPFKEAEAEAPQQDDLILDDFHTVMTTHLAIMQGKPLKMGYPTNPFAAKQSLEHATGHSHGPSPQSLVVSYLTAFAEDVAVGNASEFRDSFTPFKGKNIDYDSGERFPMAFLKSFPIPAGATSKEIDKMYDKISEIERSVISKQRDKNRQREMRHKLHSEYITKMSKRQREDRIRDSKRIYDFVEKLTVPQLFTLDKSAIDKIKDSKVAIGDIVEGENKSVEAITNALKQRKKQEAQNMTDAKAKAAEAPKAELSYEEMYENEQKVVRDKYEAKEREIANQAQESHEILEILLAYCPPVVGIKVRSAAFKRWSKEKAKRQANHESGAKSMKDWLKSLPKDKVKGSGGDGKDSSSGKNGKRALTSMAKYIDARGNRLTEIEMQELFRRLTDDDIEAKEERKENRERRHAMMNELRVGMDNVGGWKEAGLKDLRAINDEDELLDDQDEDESGIYFMRKREKSDWKAALAASQKNKDKMEKAALARRSKELEEDDDDSMSDPDVSGTGTGTHKGSVTNFELSMDDSITTTAGAGAGNSYHPSVRSNIGTGSCLESLNDSLYDVTHTSSTSMNKSSAYSWLLGDDDGSSSSSSKRYNPLDDKLGSIHGFSMGIRPRSPPRPTSKGGGRELAELEAEVDAADRAEATFGGMKMWVPWLSAQGIVIQRKSIQPQPPPTQTQIPPPRKSIIFGANPPYTGTGTDIIDPSAQPITRNLWLADVVDPALKATPVNLEKVTFVTKANPLVVRQPPPPRPKVSLWRPKGSKRSFGAPRAYFPTPVPTPTPDPTPDSGPAVDESLPADVPPLPLSSLRRFLMFLVDQDSKAGGTSSGTGSSSSCGNGTGKDNGIAAGAGAGDANVALQTATSAAVAAGALISVQIVGGVNVAVHSIGTDYIQDTED